MAFSDETIQRVWEKGTVVPTFNSDEWRKDQCGAWIGRKYYGDRDSDYGWEIDHIKPVADGGTNLLSNLRPLQWENNAEKQEGRLTCPVTSQDKSNVHGTAFGRV